MLHSFPASGRSALIAHVNNIVSRETSVPGLTQDDTLEPHCSADHLSSQPNKDGFYFCPHVIKLKLGERVDFVLHDIGSK